MALPSVRLLWMRYATRTWLSPTVHGLLRLHTECLGTVQLIPVHLLFTGGNTVRTQDHTFAVVAAWPDCLWLVFASGCSTHAAMRRFRKFPRPFKAGILHESPVPHGGGGGRPVVLCGPLGESVSRDVTAMDFWSGPARLPCRIFRDIIAYERMSAQRRRTEDEPALPWLPRGAVTGYCVDWIGLGPSRLYSLPPTSRGRKRRSMRCLALASAAA